MGVAVLVGTRKGFSCSRATSPRRCGSAGLPRRCSRQSAPARPGSRCADLETPLEAGTEIRLVAAVAGG